MSDILTHDFSNANELFTQPKGKHRHRRTQSTFNLDFGTVPVQNVVSEEFSKEMTQTHNLPDYSSTQKLIDVSSQQNNGAEVIVDDIEEIPNMGPVVPRLPLGNNPMALIKKRDLSGVNINQTNHCPVRKIDLFSDLTNIDDLTGLDTIYERKNSVESTDLESVDNIPATQLPENTGEKPFAPVNMNILPPKGQNSLISKLYQKHNNFFNTKNEQGTSFPLEQKKTHARKASADLALQPSKMNEDENILIRKDGSASKTGKSNNSKHDSIGFDKENIRPQSGESQQATKSNHTSKLKNESRPAHMRQLSLNLNLVNQPRTANLPSQILSGTQKVSSNNIKAQNSIENQKVINFKDFGEWKEAQIAAENREETTHKEPSGITGQIASKRSNKNTLDKQKQFYAMPPRDQDIITKPKTPSNNEDFSNARNKFIDDVQRVVHVEKRRLTDFKEPATAFSGTDRPTKHVRNASSLAILSNIANQTSGFASSKAVQAVHQNHHYNKQNVNPQDKAPNKSISPFKKITPNAGSNKAGKVANIITKPKEGSAKIKKTTVGNFKDELKERLLKLEREQTKKVDNLENLVPSSGSRTSVLENSMKRLINKTDILEEQIGGILQLVSGFRSEENQLKDRIIMQERQIKSLQVVLANYEQEMSCLKAFAVPSSETEEYERRLSKGKQSLGGDHRAVTASDQSSNHSLLHIHQEYPLTESSWCLTKKESFTKGGRHSPFSEISLNSNPQSTKNENKKITEGLMNEYKNYIKKEIKTHKHTKKGKKV